MFWISCIFSYTGSEAHTYYLHLEIRNYLQFPVAVEYKQAGYDTLNTLTIPANYHKEFNLVFVKLDAYPISVNFVARNTRNSRTLQLNRQISQLFQPSKRGELRIFNIYKPGKDVYTVWNFFILQ